MSTRRGHGEGSIYRRGDGRWVGSIDVGWTNGRRKRKVIYGKTRREVAEKMKVALRAQQQGSLAVDERQTLGQYLEWWLDNAARNTVRASTLESYSEKIRLHVLPSLGHVRLSRLTPAHLQQLQNEKVEQGLSPRSVAYIHAILRRALGQAEVWGLVAKNVAKAVQPPRVVRPEVVPLSLEESKRLLDAAQDDRLHALFAVAIAVGMRRGEILGLHWDDVDLENGTVRIRTALIRVGGKMQLSEPKSHRSRRTMYLPSTCVDALRRHRARQIEERLLAGELWREQGLVFTTAIGTPIDPRSLSRVFMGLCMKAGLGKRRLHDLRHTCASLLLAQGVHPRVVMETLGHSGIALTMDTYSHVMPSLQKDAADQMEAALRGVV